jgi:hypothetical protein
MPRGFSVESSAGAGDLGSRRFVLGRLTAVTLALASTIACAPVTQVQAATNSSTQAAAKKPITVTAQLGSATQGTPFSGKIVATGGLTPYHFTIRFGTLPTGLTLNPKTGVIEGTPTKAGTSEFTVRASSHDWRNLTDLGLKVTVASEKKEEKVTVTVTPASATIASGGSQQLVAEVHGSSDKKIKWNASAGTISTSGLFTAPSVTTAATATVTATSAEESEAKASATISITPVASSSLTISTSALPDASQGAAYSAGLSATGGSQPYSWSITAGSLPGGVAINDSGILSGNPLKTGSFSFTAEVTDAASHTATASLTLAVDVVNANSKFDGPAELPRVYVQSALANTPADGKTWSVTDAASLQTALNSSACGDTINLKAGATFTGAWTFPGKNCDDQHWIIVRTSAPDSSLPPEGTRITPCFAGISSLPGRPALNCSSTQNVMAKLVMGQTSGSGPIALGAGANHYRFLGLEVTRLANASAVGNLAYPTAGSTGSHIVFDRVWMHGTVHDDTTRGIYLSGLTYVALVDSYLNDFHCESNTGTCTDAQAIQGGLGTAPGGPYKIVNNFLESAAENVLFGGGHATLTPADIEIRHNHFFKPLTWMPGQPNVVLGNHGNPFVVKNHFELKNAQRVLFDGNVAENSWGGFSQVGFTIVLTPKNQITKNGDVCPICQVTDVTIRNSKFSHLGGGFQIANALDSPGGIVPPFAGERYSIHDVVLDDINDTVYKGQGQLAQVSTGVSAPLLSDVQITHVTAFPSHSLFDVGNASSPKMPNFVFSNSIVTTGAYPIWTVGGDSTTCAYNHSVPATVLNTCFANYTFSGNALIGVPSRFPPSSWPNGNMQLSDGNAVGFVNFNGGNGGDYHLKTGTQFKGAASDGRDMGADVNAIEAAIAGAD